MIRRGWQFGCLLILALVGLARAAGPLAGNDSPADLPGHEPPAPVPFLSAEEAIKTIKVAPGFRVEVVAAEPMVEHPVAMCFDPDGRLWVAEMRAYMPDVEGKGEQKPLGRISVLEDTDGDGRMDKSTVFLDHLVLPRAVLCVRGGVMVASPPNLFFCRDTDGDGVCDEKTIIASDYGIRSNPEHQPNGLMPAMDNWIYNANYDKRLRFIGGNWVFQTLPELGQWGITQDDFGRLFHNNNSSQLRGSVVNPQYVDRNPHYSAAGANELICRDQTVYPLHDTAVNRGFLDRFLRSDGTLRNFTAACAPCIYRGGIFGKEFQGNAFVCEPSANLIKRDVVWDEDGTITASQAYADREFLASTYERFRPVNLCTGPDGALYVLDMHHGLLQHKTYLTTYAKEQYIQRDLEKHLMTGRIYRIVPETGKLFDRPHLSNAKTNELIALLGHPNGWWRDTAQRLLVERQDFKALVPLQKMAASDPNSLARLHAIWTLEGFGFATVDLVRTALKDPEPKIRNAGLRLSEPLLGTSREVVLPLVMKLAEDDRPDVQLQFALTVSPLGLPQTDAAMIELLCKSSDRPLLRDAIISGLRGRELAFLQQLLAMDAWTRDEPGRASMLSALARATVNEADPSRVAQLLREIAKQSPELYWRQTAMLSGFDPSPGRIKTPKSIMLESEPADFLALQDFDREGLKSLMDRVLSIVHWPGEPGYVPPPPPPPLSAEEQARFERGRQVYSVTCIACHKQDGLGQEGLAPPLVDSEWVLGPEGRLARIIINGVRGPINVSGTVYSFDMPGLAKLSDDEIAAVATFVRRSWDHGASPVESDIVTKVRAANRPMPWSESELLKVP